MPPGGRQVPRMQPPATARQAAHPHWPLVTVFVPWIGRRDYIQQTIRALLRQSYPNLEILISDNSPGTAPLPLPGDARDRRVRIIDRTDKRLSAAEHYAACLRDARGEFAMILSDDDLIEPGYVSSMYEAMITHPGVTVCLGEQIAIGPNDVPAPAEPSVVRIKAFDGVRFVTWRLLNPRALPIITYMSLFARRADMLNIGYRDYPAGSNTDNYMMFALAMSGRVAVSSERMYYRVYESSAGLAMPFGELLASCAEFEADFAQLLRSHLASDAFVRRATLRALLRTRNATMMARRLFTMYRHRMSHREFLFAWLQISKYLSFGAHAAPRSPRHSAW